MLYGLPKIFLLLLSLCIYGLKVEGQSYNCNGGYAIDKNSKSDCWVNHPKTEAGKYKCDTVDCDLDGLKYVQMSGCKRIASNDQRPTRQNCPQYDWNPNKNDFICYSSDNFAYACPYNPYTVTPMSCTQCQLIQ